MSPLLFALSMEPFITALQNKPQITPFVLGPNSLKITIFADDITIYSTDVATALEGIIQEARKFADISGYRLSTNKTQILMNYKSSVPLQGVSSTVTYLGVRVSVRINEIVALNYEALLKETAILLKKWHKVPLGICGRINLIKMKILPKFLYLFRSILIF